MTEEPAGAETVSPKPEPKREKQKAKGPTLDRVVIWAWPKTIVFWPTCVFAIVFGFVSMATNPQKHVEAIKAEVDLRKGEIRKNEVKQVAAEKVVESYDEIYRRADSMSIEKHKWLAIIFLIVLVFNLFAFSFDIRVKGMAITVLALGGLVLLLLYLSTMTDVLKFLRVLIDKLNPYANASFYFTMGLSMLFVLIVGMVHTYLHRWDVTHNEVIIRTGLLEAEKRLGTEALTFSKEITDLMEHWFLFFGMFSKRLGCGQLVFNHPQMERPIVLDNVIGPEHKASELGKILGVLAVKNGG